MSKLKEVNTPLETYISDFEEKAIKGKRSLLNRRKLKKQIESLIKEAEQRQLNWILGLNPKHPEFTNILKAQLEAPQTPAKYKAYIKKPVGISNNEFEKIRNKAVETLTPTNNNDKDEV